MKKSLRKSLFFLFFIMVSMAFLPSQTIDTIKSSSSEKDTATPKPNVNFQAGEELVYKIYYNLNFVWIPAGEVTFKVSDKDAEYHISATGRTYSTYEWFFKVRDYYDSYVDKNTLLPNMSIRDVNEGKYTQYSKVAYDQSAKKAFFERGDDKNNIKAKGTLETKDLMHDVLSILYYCRTLDYDNASAGQEYPINVLLDEAIYPLKYKILAKEDKKIRDLGKWSTLKLSPKLISGNMFKEGTEMKIWASNDANKVPLMIETPVSVGSVKIVLKSWKGLKYPITAKKD
jgi:5-hydroxyisourate hydrolase-like protein (transthyretin family)